MAVIIVGDFLVMAPEQVALSEQQLKLSTETRRS